MIRAITDAADVLGVTCAALLLLLVGGRWRTNVLRRRDVAARDVASSAIAAFLAGGGDLVPPPKGRERRIFADACLDALVELRGAERDRLAERFEAKGLLDEAAASLVSGVRARRRRRAADALALVERDAGRQALLAGLDDRDRAVRAACARGLAALRDQAALDALDGLASGDAADVLLAVAMRDAAALRPAFAEPATLVGAAEVAGALRLLEYAPELRGLLDPEQPELCAAATRALGAIGDFDAAGPLAALAADAASPRLRALALRALGQIGDVAAAPTLERALAVDEFEPAAAAAEALTALGGAGRDALQRVAGSGGGAAALAQAELAR